MISSLNNLYPPPSSSTFQQHFHDQKLTSSRVRSASSSFIPTQSTTLPPFTIKNPLSVQPTKQARITQFNPMINSQQVFPNTGFYDDKFNKSFSPETNSQNRSVRNHIS